MGAENDYTEVYEDQAGEWRWRRKAGNHEIIAVSGEGFASRSNAERSAARAFAAVTPEPVPEAPWWLAPALLAVAVAGLVFGLCIGYAIGYGRGWDAGYEKGLADAARAVNRETTTTTTTAAVPRGGTATTGVAPVVAGSPTTTSTLVFTP